jgi:predicted nucleic acid-binding protein
VAAVSDSSPLILYARIGRLDLLGDVFGEVIVPPAVWDEAVTAGSGRPGADAIRRAPWIRRMAVARDEPVRTLLASLGPGEAEAIALWAELERPGPLLLDDRKARAAAVRLGIPVLGTAGALLRAKDHGLISAVRPLLDDLRAAGLYLSEPAARELLAITEELSPGSDPGERAR